MVAPIVFLDIPTAPRARALPGKLLDFFETRLFLRLLFSLLTAGDSVVEVSARLAFVPCVLVDNTGFAPTSRTSKDVTCDASRMDLTRITAGGRTPSKIGCPCQRSPP